MKKKIDAGRRAVLRRATRMGMASLAGGAWSWAMAADWPLQS